MNISSQTFYNKIPLSNIKDNDMSWGLERLLCCLYIRNSSAQSQLCIRYLHASPHHKEKLKDSLELRFIFKQVFTAFPELMNGVISKLIQ